MTFSRSIHVIASGIHFILFNGWVIFHCIYEPHLLNTFLCWWTLGCFYVLDIVSSAAMNVGVHVSLWTMLFSGYLLRSGIAGPCACKHAKLLQACLTLCDPMDCIPPGSSVHGSLQARILEWVTMPPSKGSSWPRDQTHISYVSCIGRQILYCWATGQAYWRAI